MSNKVFRRSFLTLAFAAPLTAIAAGVGGIATAATTGSVEFPSSTSPVSSTCQVEPNADLRNCNFEGIDLTGTDMNNANLSGANLYHTNLTNADLSGANLTGATAIRSDFTGANLTGANLTGVDFTGAGLAGAYLVDANLTSADLTSADLTSANLTGANLKGAERCDAQLSKTIAPDGTVYPDGAVGWCTIG